MATKIAADSFEQDAVDTEKENSAMAQLQAKFADMMGGPSQAKRHKKVVVLVLYWHKVKDSYLDVDDEIRKLVNVFKDKYNYAVSKKSLNDPNQPGKASQLLLHKYLADAAYEVDGDDSLLIIYYAGHGNPTDKGELLLSGGNYHPESKHPGGSIDTVVWAEAENLVHTAKRSDILLIFDCCYAGKICGTFTRKPLSIRNFEVIGATASNALTRIPGQFSFTSALIWALDQLAETKDVFTTSQLFNKLLVAPGFPANEQTPVLSERGEHSYTRLVLGPLQPGEESLDLAPTPFPTDKTVAEDFQFGLCLQLNYDQLPTPGDMESMCRGFKNMMRVNDITAKHIRWRGIFRKEVGFLEISPTVRWIAKRWASLPRTKSQSHAVIPDVLNLAAIQQERLSTQVQRDSTPGSVSSLDDCGLDE